MTPYIEHLVVAFILLIVVQVISILPILRQSQPLDSRTIKRGQ
jgi:hypothetical protein